MNKISACFSKMIKFLVSLSKISIEEKLLRLLRDGKPVPVTELLGLRHGNLNASSKCRSLRALTLAKKVTRGSTPNGEMTYTITRAGTHFLARLAQAR